MHAWNWKMFVPWIWTLHVIGSLWLSAGVLSNTVVFAQLKRTDGSTGQAFGLRLAARLMAVFVVPGVLLTGALGLYLVWLFGIARGFSLESWALVPGWVKLSILLYLIQLGGTLFIQMPQIRRAAAAPGPEPHALEGLKLAAILNHVNATFIFVQIFLMSFKPF